MLAQYRPEMITNNRMPENTASYSQVCIEYVHIAGILDFRICNAHEKKN